MSSGNRRKGIICPSCGGRGCKATDDTPINDTSTKCVKCNGRGWIDTRKPSDFIR